MNRKQKIIVSVTGVFLVLLVLVGLTYAFFLTQIKGNENPTSISVTTANLRLIYDDGSDGVIGGVNLIPSDEIYNKQFTVYNDGNANVTYGLYLINVVNTFERKDDIQFTLGCSTDGEIECGGNGITTFPSGNYRMVENTIEPGKTHTYTFRFTYKETGTDQSVDMGKELSAKIQIFGKDGQFEYIPYDEDTLAHSILKNAKSTTLEQSQTLGYAYYSETPLTTPAEVASGANESTLSLATDDYGDSYYFRGNVKNNYVNFADMCWRIVRIEGDGSVKLIMEDQDQLCNSKDNEGNLNMNGNFNVPTISGNSSGIFGYTKNNVDIQTEGMSKITAIYTLNYLNSDGTAKNHEESMAAAYKKFQNVFTTAELGKLKSGNWCLADEAYLNSDADVTTDTPMTEAEKSERFNNEILYYYDSYVRLNNTNKLPNLNCNGSIMNKFGDGETPMYVATLTADEIVYAGGKLFKGNESYYLFNDYLSYSNNSNSYGFWTLSPSSFDGIEDFALFVDAGGGIYTDFVSDNVKDLLYFRPAISLVPGTTITDGTGIIGDPYIIG